MEETVRPGQDRYLQELLDEDEVVVAAVRVRLPTSMAGADGDTADAGLYMLAINDDRLLGVRVHDAENAELDASIPIEYLAGIRHEEYDAIDELVVTLTTGASVRFEVPIGHEHSARAFVDYVETLAPTQVIPAVRSDADSPDHVRTYEVSLRRASDEADSSGVVVPFRRDAGIDTGAVDAEGDAAGPSDTAVGADGEAGTAAEDRYTLSPDIADTETADAPSSSDVDDDYFMRVSIETDTPEPGRCPHCGAQNSASAVFCSECGTEI